MGQYILRKLRDMVLTLALVVVLVFLMFSVISGNPARIMAGVNASPEKVAVIEAQLGLDQPLPVRFVRYVGGLVTGDLGHSIRFDRPVSELVGQAAPVTMTLALCAFLMVVAAAIPLGVLSARRPGGALDTVIHVATETVLAIPPFFMAIILMLIFRTGQSLSGTGASGGVDIGQLMLPAAAIALSRMAMATAFLRDALVEQSRSDYVRTARGKGASPARVIWRHMFRNSLMPMLTAAGLILAEVVGGSVIIEQVFMVPGLGRLLVTAVEARDFPLTEGIILLIATLVILVNFLVDLCNQFIDPRLRLEVRPFRRNVRRGVS